MNKIYINWTKLLREILEVFITNLVLVKEINIFLIIKL